MGTRISFSEGYVCKVFALFGVIMYGRNLISRAAKGGSLSARICLRLFLKGDVEGIEAVVSLSTFSHFLLFPSYSFVANAVRCFLICNECQKNKILQK